MESPRDEAPFYEDEHGIPVAQPLAHTSIAWRPFLRWGTAIALLAVVLGGIAWQWQSRTTATTRASAAVYLVTAQSIAALHGDDGTQQWQRATTGAVMALQHQTIVIKGAASSLAVAATSGRIMWSAATPGSSDVLFTADGMILSGPSDQQIKAGTSNVLSAQSAKTGSLLWSVAIPAGNEVTVAADASRIYVGLIRPGQTVSSQSLTAYDARSGAMLWRTHLTNTWYSFPEMQNGSLFAMTRNDFYALDAATGQTRWHAQVAVTAAPVVNGGTIYLAVGAMLAAYDTTTGLARWQVKLAGDTLTNLSSTQGSVIAQSAHTLTVLDANGTVLWHSQGQPQMAGAFLVVGTMLYFQDASGITAYRLADGLWRWHFATTLPMGATLLASGNTLYADRGDTLYALNRQTGQQQWRYQGTAPIMAVLLAA